MHAEKERRLQRHRLDVLQVLLVRPRLRRRPRELAVGVGDHLDLVQQLVAHEVEEVLRGHDPVPIVDDVAAVHDVAEDVAQVVPRDLHRRGPLEVVVQHLCRVPEIAGGEGVLHVEAHGAELLPLEHQGVEVAKREEDGLDLAVPVFEVLFAEEREGPSQVCQHALRRLVCQFDGSLEEADGDAIAGVRGQEDAELGVAVLYGEDVELLLELATPLGHQVDVLQHDPMAFFVAELQLLHGDDVLALPHRDIVIVRVRLQQDHLSPKRLHLFDRVRAGRQDEEERGDIRRVFVRREEHLVERQGAITVHVFPPVRQRLRDPLRKCGGHAVRAQATDHEQFQEVGLVQPFPLQRQFALLGRHLIEPLFEAVRGVFLHVRREPVELVKLDQLLNHAPCVVREPIAERILRVWRRRPTQEEVEIGRPELLIQLPQLKQAEGEHRAENQLVVLEQPAVHPAEYRQADARDQGVGPLLHILAWSGPLDGLVQEGDEGVERVLVHVLHDGQLVHQEEQHGPLRCDRSVQLPGVVDLDLCGLRMRDLDRDFLRGRLRLLQALHQRNVLENG
mmetsp:Transcript_4517/g.13056  ORF Transcript_4517/g.13056 Transcript_4517/m.13056 type:complete len:563 (-) Transcript_4517:3771-5459(-)